MTVAVVALLSLAGVGTAIITQASQPVAGAPAGSSPPTGLSRSVPARIRIPAIGIDSRVGVVGLQRDRTTMQLPQTAMQVDWYRDSTTPGQNGTAIIVGYIQDGREPGAFSRLADLKAAQNISVVRKDGITAVFRVDRIEQYAQGEFPAAQVYAATATPTLRIVTVGGVLRPGDKPGNVVVYSHMIKTGGAG